MARSSPIASLPLHPPHGPWASSQRILLQRELEPEPQLQLVLLWCRHISFRLVRHGAGFLLSQVFAPAGSTKAATHKHMLKINTAVC